MLQQVFHVSLYEIHIGLNGDLHSVVRKQKTEPLVTFVCLKISTEFDMPVQKFDFALRRTRGTSFISLASSEKKPPLLEVVESRRSVMDRKFAQQMAQMSEFSKRYYAVPGLDMNTEFACVVCTWRGKKTP